MIKLRHVRWFGVRYVLNTIVDWVHAHEEQSQDTLQFRRDTDKRLSEIERRVIQLEQGSSGNDGTVVESS